MVKKTIDTEAEMDLLPISLIQNIDQQAPRGNYSIHTIAKSQTQNLSLKNPRVKEFKSKLLHLKSLACSRTKQLDFSKKT